MSHYYQYPQFKETEMSERSVYKSSTLGDIPLSFTGKHLLQALRDEIEDLVAKARRAESRGEVGMTNWEPVSRARGRLAQYMSKLEGKCEGRKTAVNNAFGASLQDQFIHKQYQKVQDFVLKNRLFKGQPDNESHADIILKLAQEALDARDMSYVARGVTEYLYEFKMGSYEIRLWLKNRELPALLKKACFERFNLLTSEGHERFMEAFAKDLSVVLPGVNAVQVKEGEASVVIYPEWP